MASSNLLFLKNAIRLCNLRINELTAKRKQLEDQISRIRRAYNIIKQKYTEFEEQQRRKIKIISEILQMQQFIPAARSVYKSVLQAYKGAEYQKAKQGYLRALEDLEKRRMKLELESEDCYKQLKIEHDRLYRLEQDYQKAKLEEIAKETLGKGDKQK